MQRTKDIAKISLGAEAVNELLGGGLETKCITEMFGEFRYAMQVQQDCPNAIHGYKSSRKNDSQAVCPHRMSFDK